MPVGLVHNIDTCNGFDFDIKIFRKEMLQDCLTNIGCLY